MTNIIEQKNKVRAGHSWFIERLETPENASDQQIQSVLLEVIHRDQSQNSNKLRLSKFSQLSEIKQRLSANDVV